MPSPPLECCRRHSVYAQFLCLTVIVCWKLVSTISYKPVVGISPNLQIRCSWSEWLTDLEFKVKRPQSHWYKLSNKHFGGIVPHTSECSGCVLMKVITVTHYHVHITLMTFSGSMVHRLRSRTFSKNALFWPRCIDQQFTIEDNLVSYIDCTWTTQNRNSLNRPTHQRQSLPLLDCSFTRRLSFHWSVTELSAICLMFSAQCVYKAVVSLFLSLWTTSAVCCSPVCCSTLLYWFDSHRCLLPQILLWFCKHCICARHKEMMPDCFISEPAHDTKRRDCESKIFVRGIKWHVVINVTFVCSHCRSLSSLLLLLSAL